MEILPGALSGLRCPLWREVCPGDLLSTARPLHPWISGPLHPWDSDTCGQGASNWPPWPQTRRPLHPVTTTVKIPLFFHP